MGKKSASYVKWSVFVQIEQAEYKSKQQKSNFNENNTYLKWKMCVRAYLA
jgi:hypothetical protein